MQRALSNPASHPVTNPILTFPPPFVVGLELLDGQHHLGRLVGDNGLQCLLALGGAAGCREREEETEGIRAFSL